MQNKSKFLFKNSLELMWDIGIISQNRIYCDIAKLLFFRAGNSRNPSGGSNNGSNNPGGLPPQFVQEMKPGLLTVCMKVFSHC